jgi:hypothetical protein
MLFYEKFNPAREDMFYQPADTDFLEISQLNGNLTRSKVFIGDLQRQPFYSPPHPVAAAAEQPKFQAREVFTTLQNQLAFARTPEPQLTNGHANGHSVNSNAERRGIKRRRRYSDEYTHISVDEYKDHSLTGSSTLGESEGILSFLDAPTSNGASHGSNGTNGSSHHADLSKSSNGNAYSSTNGTDGLGYSDFININNPFDLTPNLENFSRSILDTRNPDTFSIWKPFKAVKRLFGQSPGASLLASSVNKNNNSNGHSVNHHSERMDTEKTNDNGYLSEEVNSNHKVESSTTANTSNFEFFRERQNSPNKPLDKTFYGSHTFHSRRKTQFLSPQAYAQVNED